MYSNGSWHVLSDERLKYSMRIKNDDVSYLERFMKINFFTYSYENMIK